MSEMACRISRTRSAPTDLYTLVATAFIYCEVLDFQPKAKGLHGLVIRNPKALYADDIIQTFKPEFWSLKAQGIGSPPEGKKIDIEGELAGLKMAMNKMVESQKRGHTGGNSWSKDGKAQGLIGFTCLWFHKKGHFQDICPLETKTGARSVNKETPETGSEPFTSWRYNRPENGESEAKAVNDTTYTFSTNMDGWT